MQELLTVGAAAAETGWSARMLRYLEEHGLVVPRRTEAGYRQYGLLELNRLRSLRELRRRFGPGPRRPRVRTATPPRARAPPRGRRVARCRRRQRLLGRVGAAQARAAARCL